MESSLLLTLSLIFLIAVDFLLVCTYLLIIYLKKYDTQFRLEDIRQSFSPILMVLCLFQIVFLSIGFSIISDDLYKLYQNITDPDSLTDLSRQWIIFSVAIGPLTTVGFATLCLAARRFWTTVYHSTHLSLTRIKYFWISHALLSLSAIFCVIISCHELQYEEDAFKAVRVSLVLSAFAIVSFEIGLGIWLYGTLRWLKIEVPVQISFE